MTMNLIEWQNKITSEAKIGQFFNQNLIFQASSYENVDKGIYDEWVDHPIGMAFWVFNKQKEINDAIKSDFERNNLVFVGFNPETDSARRGLYDVNRSKIKKTLCERSKDPFAWKFEIDIVDQFKELKKSKFVISPEGNGIDCHRHYEALMVGCIPIVERRDEVEKKYKNLPILWSNDYTEITSEYLTEQYSIFSSPEKTYDFSSLFVDHYDLETQNKIKNRGNYWCGRLVGKHYYV